MKEQGTAFSDETNGRAADGGGAAPLGGREPHVPRPPSPEALREISEEQALITDEWAGDEEGPPRGRGTPGDGGG